MTAEMVTLLQKLTANLAAQKAAIPKDGMACERLSYAGRIWKIRAWLDQGGRLRIEIIERA